MISLKQMKWIYIVLEKQQNVHRGIFLTLNFSVAEFLFRQFLLSFKHTYKTISIFWLFTMNIQEPLIFLL